METTDDEHNQVITSKKEKGVNLSDVLNFQHLEELPSSRSLYPLQILPYKISNAYLISTPKLQEPFENTYTKIIYEKHDFNRKIENIKMMYQQARIKNKNNVDILEHYKKMQDLLNTDPDRYFNSNYNWYYSGGTLDLVELPGSHLMIHACANSNLCLTNICHKSSQWHMINQNLTSISSNPIYEIKSSAQQTNIFIGVRSKNNFHFLKYNSENEDLCCSCIKSNESEIPYVSFCLNSEKNEEYALLNAKQMLEIWNINKNKKSNYHVTKIVNTLGENWAKVRYLSNNSIFYCNNVSFSITDLRTRFDGCTKLTSELNLGDEKITDICFKDETCFYLITGKHVTEIDSRKNQTVRKWSHLLKEKVFLSDFTRLHNDDLICISSEQPNERIILGSDNQNIKLPLLIPNLNESLDDVLISDYALDHEYYMRERISLTSTGLKLIKNKNTISVFTSNLLGDVYINEIYENKFNSNKIKDRNMAEFKYFDQKIYSYIEKTNPLYFNDKVVIKSLKSILKREKLPLDNIKINKSKCHYVELIKGRLKRKADKSKTFLNGPWEVEHPINAIDEIESSLNVQMWLSKIGDNIGNENIDGEEAQGLDDEIKNTSQVR